MGWAALQEDRDAFCNQVISVMSEDVGYVSDTHEWKKIVKNVVWKVEEVE